jgi:desulfoferrodoxin-like iron-binding protein
MANDKVPNATDWSLGDWEEALTIHVGTAYACRVCGNLVMVTRGGTGVLDLNCCGRPMERIHEPEAKRSA